uniref:TERF1-interacting nuclear factor 2 N-terminal domain-containing protein n=1 Tax=Poecilia reticulata TaxID=8081 RepID=A0A3P9QAI7_POERE
PAEPLVSEDPRRLRVLSARALSIVMKRDVQNFEAVMTFLDATHRLLPGLVPAIQHMKIQFGLKTMVGPGGMVLNSGGSRNLVLRCQGRHVSLSI